MINSINMFGLTLDQTVIMHSIQYHLVIADVDQTTDTEKKQKKRKWLENWEKSINTILKSESANSKGEADRIINNQVNMKSFISANQKSTEIKTPYYMILLEVSLFSAYFPLDGDKKKYKGLKFKRNKSLLEHYAGALKVDGALIEKYINKYKSAIKGLTGYWKKVLISGGIGAIVVAITGGFAAPAIGGALGTALSGGTLFGAAAVSSGLAALGGGAIAAGGMGIAGGIAVIVGGGVVLGGALGSTTGRLLVANPTFILSEAAKLEVVMREIVLLGQKDIRLAQELIKEQRKAINKLENEVIELSADREKNKERIKNIEKSINYLRKAAKRNEEML